MKTHAFIILATLLALPYPAAPAATPEEQAAAQQKIALRKRLMAKGGAGATGAPRVVQYPNPIDPTVWVNSTLSPYPRGGNGAWKRVRGK